MRNYLHITAVANDSLILNVTTDSATWKAQTTLKFNVIEKDRALNSHGNDGNETGKAEPAGLSSSGCR